MTKPYRNILFDLGMVLLHIDYGPAFKRAMPYFDWSAGSSPEKFFTLIARDPAIDQYERGDITGSEFFEHFVEKTGFRGTHDAFVEIWRDIFSENEPMIRFGRDLSREYGVYLASNASDMHIPYVLEAFPSLRFFKDAAFSYRLRATKPEPAFYERTLQQFGVTADTCLFIDDRPENVESAERFGIRSILYTNPEKTIARARKILGTGT